MKKVIAEMSENGYSFEEDFDIPENEDAKTYVKVLLKNFNEGRSNKRTLVKIVSENNKEDIYDWKEMLRGAGRFYDYCRRQEANAYGNRGVKADYKKIISAYRKFTIGTFGDFIMYVNKHHRSAYDDLTILAAVTKDKYKELRKQYLQQNSK